jgi:hypothetical protein
MVMERAMEKREEGTDTPIPTFATHAEAVNKFRGFAEAFMEHVHLLTEARSAYEEVMSISTELRNRLDAGNEILTSLMTRLERVVSNHLSEPVVDRKKPELVKKDDSLTARNEGTGTGNPFP